MGGFAYGRSGEPARTTTPPAASTRASRECPARMQKQRALGPSPQTYEIARPRDIAGGRTLGLRRVRPGGRCRRSMTKIGRPRHARRPSRHDDRALAAFALREGVIWMIGSIDERIDTGDRAGDQNGCCQLARPTGRRLPIARTPSPAHTGAPPRGNKKPASRETGQLSSGCSSAFALGLRKRLDRIRSVIEEGQSDVATISGEALRNPLGDPCGCLLIGVNVTARPVAPVIMPSL